MRGPARGADVRHMTVLVNRRKEDRLRREIAIHFAVEGCSGEGLILDVSRGGASLRVPAEFDARKGMVFSLHAETVPLLPTTAQLLWYRRVVDRAASEYVCGLAFSDAEANLEEWGEWVSSFLDGKPLWDE